MKTSKLILTVIFLFITTTFYSQSQDGSDINYNIKGDVVDTTGNPIAYPTISLKKDSNNADYSNRYSGLGNGSFSFVYKSVKDTVWIDVSADNKITQEVQIILSEDKTIDLGKIKLSEGEELRSVSIVAYKPLVTQDIDRIKYDVESDPESKSNTVLEILRKVPLVTIDHEDKILVKGSTKFKIYINNKPSNMVVKNPQDILKSMPASSIQRIEVITNPGVKYDAEGISAVLNIVTKGSLHGYQGSIRAEVATRKGVSAGGDFATKINKFGMKLNYSYYHYDITNNMSMKTEYIDEKAPYKYYDYISNDNYVGNRNNGNVEFSYEFDSLSLLSASFGISGGNRKTLDDISQTFLKDKNNSIITAYTSNRKSSSSDYDYTGSVDFQRGFKKTDQLLTLSYNFSLSPGKSTSSSLVVLDTNYTNHIGVPNRGNRNIGIEKGSSHTFQIDYTEPFSDKKHLVESGLKFISRYNKTESDYKLFNEINGEYDISDPIHNSNMNYIQNIIAAYASYSFRLSNFSLRFGGRLEGTFLDARFEDKAKNFSPKFFDPIPSISFSWQPTQASNVNLSYDNSISRPSLWHLNPYIDNLNPNFKKYGNPNLKSERSHNISLSYGLFTQKFNMNLSSSWSLINNSIEDVVFVEEDGTINQTVDNLGRVQHITSSVYVGYNPFSWMGFWGQINGGYSRYKNGNYDSGSPYIMGFASLYFTLPWKINFAIGGGGSSPQKEYKVTSTTWHYNYISLSKSFLKGNKLTVKLNAVNPFRKTNVYTTKISEEGVFNGTYISTQLSRYFSLSVSWRFGEMKSEIKKVERGISNTDIKSGGDSSTGSGGGGGTPK